MQVLVRFAYDAVILDFVLSILIPALQLNCTVIVRLLTSSLHPSCDIYHIARRAFLSHIGRSSRRVLSAIEPQMLPGSDQDFCLALETDDSRSGTNSGDTITVSVGAAFSYNITHHVNLLSD